jgi:hypothetical protein
MAYAVVGNDAATKLVKYKRAMIGSEGTVKSYIKFKRAVHTGEKIITVGGGTGSTRPETGQILPRGK